MGTRTVKHCDVFVESVKNVKLFDVEVVCVDEHESKTTLQVEKDLSPRGLKRLLHFIEVGTSPPRKREAKA